MSKAHEKTKKNGDDEEAGEKSASPLKGLTGWVREVDKKPGAAMLAVGLIIFLAAFVSQIGVIHIVARGSVWPAAVCGGALIGLGYLIHRQATQQLKGKDYDPIVLDRGFMLAVFQEAMPPAFIKAVPKDGKIPDEGLTHVLESDALVEMQDITQDITKSDPRYKEVIADHIAGDRAALAEHRSYYLELAPRLAGSHARPIFTFKTRVTYRGRHYVIGWYVPIHLDRWPDEDELRLMDEGRLIKFRIAKAPGKGRDVHVGGAIKSGAFKSP